jgi:hypothetical protein
MTVTSGPKKATPSVFRLARASSFIGTRSAVLLEGSF